MCDFCNSFHNLIVYYQDKPSLPIYDNDGKVTAATWGTMKEIFYCWRCYDTYSRDNF